MNRTEQLTQLKQKVEDRKQQRDRAEGRLEETKQRMKEEFGVSTLKQTKEQLKKFVVMEKKTSTAFETALKEFEEEWSEKLQ